MVDLYGGSYATEGEHYKFKYTYDSGNNMTSYSVVYCCEDDEIEVPLTKTMTYGGTYWADQISSVGNKQYSYDAVGNLVSDGRYVYTWENGRELSAIKGNSGHVYASFEYDSSGLRISKELDYEGGIRYAYDENSNLIFERHNEYVLAFHYDGNGIRTHFDYIVGNNVVSTYYYRYNLQGDVIALLSTSGEVVAEYEYDPYGSLINMPSEIGEINPFTYRGYYYDWGLGLYYLQSRYYNSNTCRFLNADDTAFLGASGTLLGLNLYAYCENDPINAIDPSGCIKIKICVISPNPGSTVVWAYKNGGFSVGHTYVILDPEGDKSLNNGKTIIRGFGPGTTHTALLAIGRYSVNGKISNETGKESTCSVSYTITKKQFNAVKDFLYSAPKKYNVVSYNCTTFAIEALNKAGIKHGFKKHFWNMGKLKGVTSVLRYISRVTFRVRSDVSITCSLAADFFSSFSLSYGYTPARLAYDINKGIR